MRALITGGAGFVGSHLAEALLKGGAEVAVTDDLSTGSIDNIEHLKGLKGFSYTIETVLNRPHLAELVDPEPRSGRWWPRAALDAAEAPLAADSRSLVARWAAGEVAIAEDTPWSRHGWHAAAGSRHAHRSAGQGARRRPNP